MQANSQKILLLVENIGKTWQTQFGEGKKKGIFIQTMVPIIILSNSDNSQGFRNPNGYPKPD